MPPLAGNPVKPFPSVYANSYGKINRPVSIAFCGRAITLDYQYGNYLPEMSNLAAGDRYLR